MTKFKKTILCLGLLAVPAFADKIKFVVVPATAHQGDRVSIVATTTPNAKATLDLTGPDRRRTDYQGLGAQTADDKGKVEWVFLVPQKAALGSYTASVHQGRDGQTRRFELAK